jgi:RecB family endonuclease NucS
MTPYEHIIRDALAQNLSVLEPDLVLVRTEYPVPAPNSGAGGRLDILARDQLGHYVIIELKRSDHSARDALHELEKYMGLLPFHLSGRLPPRFAASSCPLSGGSCAGPSPTSERTFRMRSTDTRLKWMRAATRCA